MKGARKQMTLLLPVEDESALETMLAGYPFATRHRLAQIIFRVGLRACIEQPQLVLDGAKANE